MLNSILLEGMVKNISSEYLRNGKHICSFSIIANRYKPEEDDTSSNTIIIPIKCMGAVAQMCERYFKAGTYIRIVGNLNRDNENRIIVFAEHIELKIQNTKEVEE